MSTNISLVTTIDTHDNIYLQKIDKTTVMYFMITWIVFVCFITTILYVNKNAHEAADTVHFSFFFSLKR